MSESAIWQAIAAPLLSLSVPLKSLHGFDVTICEDFPSSAFVVEGQTVCHLRRECCLVSTSEVEVAPSECVAACITRRLQDDDVDEDDRFPSVSPPSTSLSGLWVWNRGIVRVTGFWKRSPRGPHITNGLTICDFFNFSPLGSLEWCSPS